MEEKTKTYVFNPDNGMNNAWPWLAMNNNGFGNGFGGWGGGILGFFLGLLFGNNGFFGNGGFGNGAGAGFLSNQINNDSGRELLMNAITSQGERQHEAISTLSTMLGQDFNLVNSSIQTISTGLNQIANAQGMGTLQVINAIQAGNASMASQLCECCCNMKQLVTEQGYQGQLRTIEQTNTLGNAISANGRGITDAIADLKTSMISEFCAARERDMQSKIDMQGDIITQLRNQISNDNQTLAFNRAFAALDDKIDAIAAKQPNTVPVQWPQLTAVNTTPYVSGGIYGNFNSPFNF